MSHKHCVFCGEEVLNDGKLTPCNASNNTLPADTVGNRSHAVQSGAPFQPGATQPEHDGVAHKCKYARNAVVQSSKAECPFGLHAIYTKAELTTLLERMARLVVREHRPVIVHDSWDDPSVACSCGWNLDAHQLDTSWPLHLTQVQLQQLREAVERP